MRFFPCVLFLLSFILGRKPAHYHSLFSVQEEVFNLPGKRMNLGWEWGESESQTQAETVFWKVCNSCTGFQTEAQQTERSCRDCKRCWKHSYIAKPMARRRHTCGTVSSAPEQHNVFQARSQNSRFSAFLLCVSPGEGYKLHHTEK